MGAFCIVCPHSKLERQQPFPFAPTPSPRPCVCIFVPSSLGVWGITFGNTLTF